MRRLPLVTPHTVHAEGPSGFEAYARAGECTRCGSCCTDCEHVRMDAAGVATCTARSSEKYLAGCVVWPTHPSQLSEHPRCGYRFERVG